MDVQASDGRSMLLRYVATYLPKFSDAFAQEWLNDHASDFAIARRVLTEYRPLEPEMVLQLASFLFRPCRTPGSVKRIVAPNPLQGEPSLLTQAYMESDWRNEEMSLLEFLRKVVKRPTQWNRGNSEIGHSSEGPRCKKKNGVFRNHTAQTLRA